MAVDMKTCHYCVLGVTFGADTPEIKKAYHQRARENHPDKHVAADRARQTTAMQKILDAWEILKDPMRRLEYDLYHDWCDDCRPRLSAQPAWRPRRNTTASTGVTGASVDPVPRPSTSSGRRVQQSDPYTAYGRHCGRMQHFGPLPKHRDPDRVPTPTSGHPPNFNPYGIYDEPEGDGDEDPTYWDGKGKADVPRSSPDPEIHRSAGPAPPAAEPPSVIDLTPNWKPEEPERNIFRRLSKKVKKVLKKDEAQEDATPLQRQSSNASKGRMRRFFS